MPWTASSFQGKAEQFTKIGLKCNKYLQIDHRLMLRCPVQRRGEKMRRGMAEQVVRGFQQKQSIAKNKKFSLPSKSFLVTNTPGTQQIKCNYGNMQF